MKHLSNWLTRFPAQRVLVIGDVVLDEYVIGKATRMSREAPVPVLEYEKREFIPGGAANPAVNIATLQAGVHQVGVVGDDAQASQLKQALLRKGVKVDALITDPTRPTTLKTRWLAHMGLRFPQQVARMDTLSRVPISPATQDALLTQVIARLGETDAILFSDYGNGLLQADLVASIQRHAHNLLLTVDAQGNFDKYVGVDVMKCNADEAEQHLKRPLDSHDAFAWAASTLCHTLRLRRGMVITRGADGATVADVGGTVTHCAAPVVADVFDTVGAGDTAIALITLAVGAGAPLTEAVTLANYASGLVVQKFGNYAPTVREIAHALGVNG